MARKNTIIRIINDYGEKSYTVSSHKSKIYNLVERTFDGHRLRYNRKENTIEAYDEGSSRWFVYNHLYYAKIEKAYAKNKKQGARL